MQAIVAESWGLLGWLVAAHEEAYFRPEALIDFRYLREGSATTGAEARIDFEILRGAEAPLFHGASRIC
jgi:hypothetical protein